MSILGACRGGTPSSGAGAGGAGGATSTASGVFQVGSGAGGQCGFGGASDVDTGCKGVVGTVRFSTDVAPILDGCTGELCHGAFTHAAIVGVASTECCDPRLIVKPGDVNHSYIIDKIRGHHLCGGAQMPLELPPVALATDQTLVQWICGGALDD